ncbi:MAG: murein biosynthesis integral membrane protein MurJ [Microbacteriaceae bacterium]
MTTTVTTGGLGRASALLAAGTIVSRILGFISAVVLAQTLGTKGSGADTFALANQLPNNIYAIIAGGLLSAVLVPQIVRAALHDDGGQRFINKLLTLGGIIFFVAAAVATIGAPLLVALYSQQGDSGPGFTREEIALATAFAYWCLPQVLFYALYSLFGEVLNARRVFGPFTWAPVLNNVVVISGLITFTILFGGDPAHRDASTWTPPMIALLGGSATLGIALQAAMLTLFWRKAGLSFRPDFVWRGVGLGATGKAASWVFGMIVVTQLAGIVQTNVASLASGNDASLAILRYAWLIFMLPHSIVAVSITTAYFTRMSQHARDGKRESVRADLSASLRTIGLFLVFSSAGLIVLAFPFSAVFASDFVDIQSMAFVLMAYLCGLVPFSVLFVLQRTFYALEDTRTPFLMQLIQAGLFVVGALSVATWPSMWIAVGIASATSLAGTAQAVVAIIVLRRKLGRLDGAQIARSYVTFALAALPSALVGAAILHLLGGTSAEGFAVSGVVGAVTSMGVIGTSMALVYVGILALVRNRELASIAGPLAVRILRRS